MKVDGGDARRLELSLPWPRRSTVAMGLLFGVPAAIAIGCPGVVAPFLLAAVLAYLINPIVVALQRVFDQVHRLCLRSAPTDEGRPLAVTLLFLWALTVIALFGFPLLVAMLSNLYSLADAISVRSPTEYQEVVRRVFTEYRGRLEAIPGLSVAIKKLAADPEQIVTIGSVVDWLARFVGRQLQGMASLMVSLFSAGASLALVPLLLFYMLTDWERLRVWTREAIPADYTPWFEDFLERLDRVLGGYLRAQLLICTVFGLAMTGGLAMLSIPYALLLGPLAGAANFVPYLGTIVGLTPAGVLVILQTGFTIDSAWTLGGLLLLFFALHMLDGFVLQPRIMSDRVGLHPLTILLALALGQGLGGLYGLLLAVPAAAFLKVLLADLRRLLY